MFVEMTAPFLGIEDWTRTRQPRVICSTTTYSIMADVEMKPADTTQVRPEDKEVKEPTPPPTPAAEIKSNIALIEKAVWSLEPRFTHRVLRSFTSLRKKLDDTVLREAIQEVYPTGI